jgi:hypothetical protein
MAGSWASVKLTNRSKRTYWILGLVVVAGFLVRLCFALLTHGRRFDIESLRLYGVWLTDGHPFDIYRQANTGQFRLAYAPGSFPLVLVARKLSAPGLLSFPQAIRIVLSLCDVGLALLIFSIARWRLESSARALAAAGAVALGPTLITVSGFHGQLDTVAWLPAVAGLWLWEREAAHRAMSAGVLIGIGIAVKTVPGLLLFALLPTARSRREVLTLVGSAIAVPCVLLVPFALNDVGAVMRALRYRGVGGVGGLSLLVQPDLSLYWLSREPESLTALSQHLQQLSGLLTAASVVPTVAICRRARTPASRVAVMLVLGVYVAGANFLVTYAAWAAVLLLAAGLVRWSILWQMWLLVPTLLTYTAFNRPGGWSHGIVYGVYVPMMIVVLVGCALAWWHLARSELRRAAGGVRSRSGGGQQLVLAQNGGEPARLG